MIICVNMACDITIYGVNNADFGCQSQCVFEHYEYGKDAAGLFSQLGTG